MEFPFNVISMFTSVGRGQTDSSSPKGHEQWFQLDALWAGSGDQVRVNKALFPAGSDKKCFEPTAKET